MKSWSTLLIEFAKLSHKEIKQKDGQTVVSYQTTYFGQILVLGNQIIEYTLNSLGNGTEVTIASRLLATQNDTALVLYFVSAFFRYGLFDYFGKNQENIDKITSSLKIIFPNSTIIKPLRNDNSADEKITISLVSLAIIKIIYILIVAGVIVLVLSTLLNWIIQAYQHNGISYF